MLQAEAQEAVKRVNAILTTLAEKREALDKAKSDLNRLTIEEERLRKALDQTRIQLSTELRKFDPGILEAMGAFPLSLKAGSRD